MLSIIETIGVLAFIGLLALGFLRIVTRVAEKHLQESDKQTQEDERQW